MQIITNDKLEELINFAKDNNIDKKVVEDMAIIGLNERQIRKEILFEIALMRKE